MGVIVLMLWALSSGPEVHTFACSPTSCDQAQAACQTVYLTAKANTQRYMAGTVCQPQLASWTQQPAPTPGK